MKIWLFLGVFSCLMARAVVFPEPVCVGEPPVNMEVAQLVMMRTFALSTFCPSTNGTWERGPTGGIAGWHLRCRRAFTDGGLHEGTKTFNLTKKISCMGGRWVVSDTFFYQYSKAPRDNYTLPSEGMNGTTDVETIRYTLSYANNVPFSMIGTQSRNSQTDLLTREADGNLKRDLVSKRIEKRIWGGPPVFETESRTRSESISWTNHSPVPHIPLWKQRHQVDNDTYVLAVQQQPYGGGDTDYGFWSRLESENRYHSQWREFNENGLIMESGERVSTSSHFYNELEPDKTRTYSIATFYDIRNNSSVLSRQTISATATLDENPVWNYSRSLQLGNSARLEWRGPADVLALNASNVVIGTMTARRRAMWSDAKAFELNFPLQKIRVEQIWPTLP